MNNFPAEAEFVHCSRVEVLNENISFLDKFCQDFLSVGGGGVEGQRFLVGVELKEVVAWFIGEELEFLTGCVARSGAFDLYDFGSKPGKHLST